MKKYIIIDDPIFLSILKEYIDSQKEVVLITNPKIKKQTRKGLVHVITSDLADPEIFESFLLTPDDRVLVCVRTRKIFKQCIRLLKAIDPLIPLVVVNIDEDYKGDCNDYENVYCVSLNELLMQKCEALVNKYENKQKLQRLKEVNSSADNVLILVQNDPDPDAIASGLALRVLLGRNKQTAPIGSFGTVTRSENINMINLLDIPVKQVQQEDLAQYSKIFMVDVQPPYFKGMDIHADVVIDHHSCSEKYETDFSDIRIPYGATATILSEYLLDADYKITRRLATALIYAIKTDTMFLDRDIDQADIQVFTELYPKVNLNLLRRIEHATLDYGERSNFVKALKNSMVVDAKLFAFLGRVEREDIIPRLADFCLQISGTEWAFVYGIYENNLICSMRNVGYVKHAGELAARVFSEIGNAGGHRSMAKAVVPVRNFKKHYGVRTLRDIADKVHEIVCKEAE